MPIYICVHTLNSLLYREHPVMNSSVEVLQNSLNTLVQLSRRLAAAQVCKMLLLRLFSSSLYPSPLSSLFLSLPLSLDHCNHWWWFCLFVIIMGVTWWNSAATCHASVSKCGCCRVSHCAVALVFIVFFAVVIVVVAVVVIIVIILLLPLLLLSLFLLF